MTDWDSEDFDPDAGFSKPPATDRWDGEDEDDVKDAWDDEDEGVKDGENEENKAEEGTESTGKAFQVKKKKKNIEDVLKKKEEKRRENIQKQQGEEENNKELTPEEQLVEKLKQEEIQKDADLELTKEMFAAETTLVEDSLDALHPTTKEQFDRFAKLLKAKLGTLESSPFYVDFLEDVMKDTCINLDTDYVKRIGTSITAIATEKAKAQKAAVKGKKKSKKGVLVGSTKAGKSDELTSYDDMEDFV